MSSSLRENQNNYLPEEVKKGHAWDAFELSLNNEWECAKRKKMK